MGKKTATTKKSNVAFRSLSSMTLREESSGKRKININAKSLLKLDHLRNVARWASGEACALPLGAFFGNRLAALEESLGSRPDPTLFTCEKCESEIQPSYNLTVRIEKNAAKTRRRRKKHPNPPHNYVVYRCHFCAHRNLKRGTPGHHMRTICPSKPKSFLKPDKVDEGTIGKVEANWMDDFASVSMDPSTPLISMTLMEAKSKRRTRTKKKIVQ